MDGAELDDVLAFLAAFDAGSFAAASAMLGRDASIVSRRVSALEARLGVRLIERTTRRLAPTEAGTAFYRRMRAALSMMDEASAEIAQSSHVASGLLRIALPATFGQRWIGPMLPAFLAAWPQVTIEAEFSDRYVDLVHERFDLAVRLGDLADSRLVARRLASNDRIAVASPAYLARHGTPVSPDDLTAHACLPNPRLEGFPDWHFRRGDAMVAVRVNGPLTADDSTSLVAAAAEGIGITVCARWLIAEELASGRLVRVLADWEFEHSGGIHLVRPSSRYTPLKTRVFSDWLVDRFAIPPWAS
ncbi:LysR family transcriptional regulator [Paraburkholderia solisilvae]|uniref:HTH-type transcriptional regulator DmlR n=1 Tax=Paraburkholderia solisilvae TaxID=624376 RepID=A0A6J5D7T0_9BURK|nr:LysR family transcriptional regulator [Paraburkholderia solisilvae]CAB3748955.1 HTH-type transcriptional regulator DmlR [Paraburkholderia solisilvae]